MKTLGLVCISQTKHYLFADWTLIAVYRPALIRRLRRLEKELQLTPEECCQWEGELRTPKVAFHRAVRSYGDLVFDAQGVPIKTTGASVSTLKQHFPTVASPYTSKRETKTNKENIAEVS